MTDVLGEIYSSLGRATRMLFFRRVQRFSPDPSLCTVLALGVLAVVGDVLFAAAKAGDHLTFSPEGLAYSALGYVVLALLLWFGKPRIARFGLATVLADSFAIAAFTGALLAAESYLPAQIRSAADIAHLSPALAIVLWWAAATWRAGRVAWTGSEWRFGIRPAFIGLLVTLLMPSTPPVTGSETKPRVDAWQIAQAYWYYYGPKAKNGDIGDEDYDYKSVDVEGTYYKQPDLVRAALDRVSPSNPNRSEIYFLAGAAYAEQNVFRSEVEKSRALFDERFATKGHSASAMNDHSTVDSLPLLNGPNLEALLSGFGAKMDPENDVLVLFLTSHGSKGHFAVSFSGFSPNDITPEQLRAMLDKAKIKNRVLIISACYSGSFIPALKDDNTLIITAASDSRTSFGCSNKREWTYFGDAFFNHALRETFSFEAAFNKARAMVADWERDQKITASDPQMAEGAAIHEILRRLSSELAGPLEPPAPPVPAIVSGSREAWRAEPDATLSR